MGDTVREAAETLASLLNASTNYDDGNTKSPSPNNHTISKLGDDDWEHHYSRLQVYIQTNQHINVPKDGTHDDLHYWIKMQKAKSAYLQPQQVSALQKIGVLPMKISHGLFYSNPPNPPPKRRKVKPVVTPKKEKSDIKEVAVPAPNPYSNADKNARERAKVSRAERAKRRLGDESQNK
jgi:hypothetical protein